LLAAERILDLDPYAVAVDPDAANRRSASSVTNSV
jgi:hypothetical protein